LLACLDLAHALPLFRELEVAVPHAFAEYLFLSAVLLPPVALAIGFLYLISPHGLARTERSHSVTAKAH
jgi:hypothetical protein